MTLSAEKLDGPALMKSREGWKMAYYQGPGADFGQSQASMAKTWSGLPGKGCQRLYWADEKPRSAGATIRDKRSPKSYASSKTCSTTISKMVGDINRLLIITTDSWAL